MQSYIIIRMYKINFLLVNVSYDHLVDFVVLFDENTKPHLGRCDSCMKNIREIHHHHYPRLDSFNRNPTRVWCSGLVLIHVFMNPCNNLLDNIAKCQNWIGDLVVLHWPTCPYQLIYRARLCNIDKYGLKGILMISPISSTQYTIMNVLLHFHMLYLTFKDNDKTISLSFS